LACVEEEGGVPGRCLYRVNIGKFHRGEEEVLVNMPGVDICPKDLFDHPVGSLGLTVGLGVEGGGEGELGADKPEPGVRQK
jgi:hypothetical protein